MTKIAQSKYGYFDADNNEYVITRPDTPRPWYNYMMNDTYVAMISNTSGGVSYDTDPSTYRLLRYRYQNVPFDRPGRYIYVRDNDTQKYWSSSWAPVCTPVDECEYSCRVGMGYNIISMKYEGISTEVKYFVPRSGKVEIWDFKITNDSKRIRNISTYSYAEFAFWGVMRDLMFMAGSPNMSRQKMCDDAILHFSYNDIGTGLHDMNFVQTYGFHYSSMKPYGYNGNRDKFIGSHRNEKEPIVVEKGESTNYCKIGGYPIGSLEHRFVLKPGQSERVIFSTGMSKTSKSWKSLAKKYTNPSACDKAFEQVKKNWKSHLDVFKVDTPDPEFDALVNGFVQYQSAVTMRLSRSISPYEWGVGRSIGFRDSSQDQLGMMHSFPELSKAMLNKLLSAVYEDGSACHNFNPLTNEWGVNGFYDDHNWLAIAVEQYVKETGEVDFLKEESPYALSNKKGTVFEHLCRCNDLAFKLRGKNGLMQIGHADWNDSLNPEDKKTESIFTSALYCASTLCLIEIAKLLNEKRYVATLRRRYKNIKDKMNDIGWDGGWYKRMIHTDGTVLGSKTTKEYGRIFLEPQPWAVISGVAEDSQAIKCLDNVEKRLGCPDGHKIMDRPFKKFDMKKIGSAGINPPGSGENGAVFNHASSWMITAEAIAGRGDKAMKYFKQMCGTAKSDIIDTYECEPYVICQYVTQKPYPAERSGRNPWLTGTASWMAKGALQHIVGCRGEFDGLVIDPCIPPEWKEFSFKRVFRKSEYNIQVSNPDGVSKGVREIRIGDDVIVGNKIPLIAAGKKIRVNVIMG